MEKKLFRANYQDHFLDQVLTECVQIVGMKAKMKKIQIAQMIEPDLNQKFKIDKERFQQVVLNLLSNALKFSNQNTKVILAAYLSQETTRSSSDPENFVHVKVIDTGIGISRKDQECLFKPFTHIAKNSRFNPNGNGLGLYLSLIHI